MAFGGLVGHGRIVGTCLTLLAVMGAFTALPARAQGPLPYQGQSIFPDRYYLPLGGYDSAFWFIEADTLWAVDLPGGAFREARPMPGAFDVYDPIHRPQPYSASIDPASGTVWTWDSSVGPVTRFNLVDRTLFEAYPLYSSRVQNNHAGALHPVTGRPVAFGGYGYYRVHDLMVTFDDRAQTWVEVASSSHPRPEARHGVRMVTGWHPTKLVIAGGTGRVTPDTPSLMNRVLADAWVFDFADSSWAEVPLPERVRCAFLTSSTVVGDYIVEPASHSVLLYSISGCPPDPAFDSGEILRWYPESGRVETMSRLGQATPNGFAVSGMVLSADSAEVYVVLSQPTNGIAAARTPRQVLRFDVVAPEASPRLPLSQQRWPWMFAVIPVLLLGLWLVLRGRSETGPAEIRMGVPGADVRIRCGRRDVVRPLTPGGHRLLEEVLRRQPASGDILSSDDLADLFEDSYSDLDSARVAKNRAVSELNDIFREVCGSELLERVRRSDDGRRFDWKVVTAVRAGE